MSVMLQLQITLFAAIMCIDKRRQEARRLDVVLCFKSARPANGGILCGACGEGVPKEKISTKAMRYLGHVLVLKPVKVVVLAVWLGLLIAGIIGATRMRVDADVNDFIPDGSYLKDFYKLYENTFTTTGDAVDVYFRSTDAAPLDFSNPRIGTQMDAVEQIVIANPWTLNSSYDSWYTLFKEASGGALEQVCPSLGCRICVCSSAAPANL
jgi:Niemann-Pick C1 protein